MAGPWEDYAAKPAAAPAAGPWADYAPAAPAAAPPPAVDTRTPEDVAGGVPPYWAPWLPKAEPKKPVPFNPEEAIKGAAQAGRAVVQNTGALAGNAAQGLIEELANRIVSGGKSGVSPERNREMTGRGMYTPGKKGQEYLDTAKKWFDESKLGGLGPAEAGMLGQITKAPTGAMGAVKSLPGAAGDAAKAMVPEAAHGPIASLAKKIVGTKEDWVAPKPPVAAGEQSMLDATRGRAQANGYITPAEGGIKGALAGVAGKAKEEKWISAKNSENAAKRFQKEIGLPEGEELSPEALGARKNQAYSAYNEMAAAAGPKLKPTTAFSTAMKDALKQTEEKIKFDPVTCCAPGPRKPISRPRRRFRRSRTCARWRRLILSPASLSWLPRSSASRSSLRGCSRKTWARSARRTWWKSSKPSAPPWRK